MRISVIATWMVLVGLTPALAEILEIKYEGFTISSLMQIVIQAI